MTDPDDDPAPPRRSRLRLLRTISLRALGVSAVIVIGLFAVRWQAGRLGQRQLTAVTERLDADDPGWRLDAILDARLKAAPPADENAAPKVLEIAERVPEAWRTWYESEDSAPWWGLRADNHFPPQTVTAGAREHAGVTLPVRTDALRLRHTRGGQFPLTIAPDPLATLLPHLRKCHTVASLLRYDGYLSAAEKNPNRGISAARASLAVARSTGGEVGLVAQHTRIMCAELAAETAVQVLAWGEPTEELAELQAELLAEAEFAYFRTGVRAERGLVDRVFRGLEDGTIPAEHWFEYMNVRAPGPEHYAAFRAYRALIPGDHAKALQLLTAYHDAAKLPAHEQLAAVRAVPVPGGPPGEFRYVLARLLVPSCKKFADCQKCAETGLRCRAELLTAAAGVACERFRMAHGRWPRDLAELTPGLLPAVPLNPFDGTPLGYRLFADCAAVYCFWPEAPMAVEFPEEFRPGAAPVAGIGYRVWNPDQRGLPAKEK